MGRVVELPPPPVEPIRSPEVTFRGERAILLKGPAGVLDARLFGPSDARYAVVVCHPHPLYGGSMHSPVPLSISKGLSERGDVAYVRFNFRGVPKSEGMHDHGRGEIDDVAAALNALREHAPGASVSLCGHSFGSWVGLKAAGREPGVDRVALVGPSIRFFQFDPKDGAPFDGRLAIFLGTEDEFCDPEEGKKLAEILGAELRLFDGFDHHFMKSRRALSEQVVKFLLPERSF